MERNSRGSLSGTSPTARARACWTDLPRRTDRTIEAADGFAHRTLYRIGNYDLYNEDFPLGSGFPGGEHYQRPVSCHFFERQEWGPFIGTVSRVAIDGQARDYDDIGYRALQVEHSRARERFAEIRRIEQSEIGAVNHYIEQARLELRRVALEHGQDSPEHQEARRSIERRIAELEEEYQALAARAAAIKEQDARFRLTLSDVDGTEKDLPLSQVVRFYPANQLSTFGKLGVYFSRWGEFLTSEPREANTEGGILPAIFGTVAMTLIMVIFVAPLGVITALYLREYARQGRLVSMVRISVNNLAGVPSIVYGVFGLGFFAYTVGSGIDQLFYPERLPNPTFGTGGILWASLTLALLTVPVVIVASEEALAAVPRSMREGIAGLRRLHLADHTLCRAATGHARSDDRADTCNGPRGRRGGTIDAGGCGEAGTGAADRRLLPLCAPGAEFHAPGLSHL
jgi:phosphate transport system permease protein